MSRYFIHMAYDGGDYFGWQIQANEKTVQQVLEHALSTLLKREISVSGAGRTDTGVHASYFVAHFDLDSPEAAAVDSSSETYLPSSEQFVFKLNRFLPPDIVVYKITSVREDMHGLFCSN